MAGGRTGLSPSKGDAQTHMTPHLAQNDESPQDLRNCQGTTAAVSTAATTTAASTTAAAPIAAAATTTATSDAESAKEDHGNEIDSFVDGWIDRTSLDRLTKDLVTKWNTAYSDKLFPTCSFFDGEYVDQDKN